MAKRIVTAREQYEMAQPFLRVGKDDPDFYMTDEDNPNYVGPEPVDPPQFVDPFAGASAPTPPSGPDLDPHHFHPDFKKWMDDGQSYWPKTDDYSKSNWNNYHQGPDSASDWHKAWQEDTGNDPDSAVQDPEFIKWMDETQTPSSWEDYHQEGPASWHEMHQEAKAPIPPHYEKAPLVDLIQGYQTGELNYPQASKLVNTLFNNGVMETFMHPGGIKNMQALINNNAAYKDMLDLLDGENLAKLTGNGKYDLHTGEAKATGITPDIIKKYYPDHDDETIANWVQNGNQEAQHDKIVAHLNKITDPNNGSMYNPTAAKKWRGIYEDAFGKPWEGKHPNAPTLAELLTKHMPDQDWHAPTWNEGTMPHQKQRLNDLIEQGQYGSSQLAEDNLDKLYKVYHEHFGQHHPSDTAHEFGGDADAANLHDFLMGNANYAQHKTFNTPEFKEWWANQSPLTQEALSHDPGNAAWDYQQFLEDKDNEGDLGSFSPYDPEGFTQDYLKNYPGTTWGVKEFSDPAQAKAVLENIINEPEEEGVGSYDPDEVKAWQNGDSDEEPQYHSQVDYLTALYDWQEGKQKAQALLNKWFGETDYEDEDEDTSPLADWEKELLGVNNIPDALLDGAQVKIEFLNWLKGKNVGPIKKFDPNSKSDVDALNDLDPQVWETVQGQYNYDLKTKKYDPYAAGISDNEDIPGWAFQSEMGKKTFDDPVKEFPGFKEFFGWLKSNQSSLSVSQAAQKWQEMSFGLKDKWVETAQKNAEKGETTFAEKAQEAFGPAGFKVKTEDEFFKDHVPGYQSDADSFDAQEFAKATGKLFGIDPQHINGLGDTKYKDMTAEQAKKEIRYLLSEHFREDHDLHEPLKALYNKFFENGGDDAPEPKPELTSGQQNPNVPPLAWMQKHFSGTEDWSQEDLDNWLEPYKNNDPSKDGPSALDKWNSDHYGDKDVYLGNKDAKFKHDYGVMAELRGEMSDSWYTDTPEWKLWAHTLGPNEIKKYLNDSGLADHDFQKFMASGEPEKFVNWYNNHKDFVTNLGDLVSNDDEFFGPYYDEYTKEQLKDKLGPGGGSANPIKNIATGVSQDSHNALMASPQFKEWFKQANSGADLNDPFFKQQVEMLQDSHNNWTMGKLIQYKNWLTNNGQEPDFSDAATQYGQKLNDSKFFSWMMNQGPAEKKFYNEFPQYALMHYDEQHAPPPGPPTLTIPGHLNVPSQLLAEDGSLAPGVLAMAWDKYGKYANKDNPEKFLKAISANSENSFNNWGSGDWEVVADDWDKLSLEQKQAFAADPIPAPLAGLVGAVATGGSSASAPSQQDGDIGSWSPSSAPVKVFQPTEQQLLDLGLDPDVVENLVSQHPETFKGNYKYVKDNWNSWKDKPWGKVVKFIDTYGSNGKPDLPVSPYTPDEVREGDGLSRKFQDWLWKKYDKNLTPEEFIDTMNGWDPEHWQAAVDAFKQEPDSDELARSIADDLIGWGWHETSSALQKLLNNPEKAQDLLKGWAMNDPGVKKIYNKHFGYDDNTDPEQLKYELAKSMENHGWTTDYHDYTNWADQFSPQQLAWLLDHPHTASSNFDNWLTNYSFDDKALAGGHNYEFPAGMVEDTSKTKTGYPSQPEGWLDTSSSDWPTFIDDNDGEDTPEKDSYYKWLLKQTPDDKKYWEENPEQAEQSWSEFFTSGGASMPTASDFASGAVKTVKAFSPQDFLKDFRNAFPSTIVDRTEVGTEAKAHEYLKDMLDGNFLSDTNRKKMEAIYKKWFSNKATAPPPGLGDGSGPSGAPRRAPEEHLKGMIDTIRAPHTIFNDKDLALAHTPGFQKWFKKAPDNYRAVAEKFPVVALEDFKDGGTYSAVPEADEGDAPTEYKLLHYPEADTSGGKVRKPSGEVVQYPGQWGKHWPGHTKNPEAPKSHGRPKVDFVNKGPDVENQLEIPLPGGSSWEPEKKYPTMRRGIYINFDRYKPTGDHHRLLSRPGEEGARHRAAAQMLDEIKELMLGTKVKDPEIGDQMSLFHDEASLPEGMPSVNRHSDSDDWMDLFSWGQKNNLSPEQMWQLAKQSGSRKPEKWGTAPLSYLIEQSRRDPLPMAKRIGELIGDPNYAKEFKDNGYDLSEIHNKLNRIIRGGWNESYDDRPEIIQEAKHLQDKWFGDQFLNDLLAKKILDYLETGGWKPSEFKSHPVPGGIGPHWTTKDDVDFGDTDPSERGFPVTVVADWLGLGEDPDSKDGARGYDSEKEITKNPGTPLRIKQLRIRHPRHPKHDWIDLNVKPHIRYARQEPLPPRKQGRAILSHSERYAERDDFWDDWDEIENPMDSGQTETKFGPDMTAEQFWALQHRMKPDNTFHFPNNGLNPPSNASSRPNIQWQHRDPEHPKLDDSMPQDRVPQALFRGIAINLKDPAAADLHRLVFGHHPDDEHLFDMEHSSEPNWNHPELGHAILDYLENNRPVSDGPHPVYGLGPHWSVDPTEANGFAMSEAQNALRDPDGLYLPVRLHGRWKGLGEDPYRSGTGEEYDGQFADESEMTLLPGAGMNIHDLQIRPPRDNTGRGYDNWKSVLDTPQFRHAALAPISQNPRSAKRIISQREWLEG